MARRKDRMPTACDEASNAHALGASTDNSLVILIRGGVDVVHLCTATYSIRVASDDPSRAVELELALVVCDLVEMMSPNRERSGRIGAAHVVVAGILDVQADVVLAGWLHIELANAGTRQTARREYGRITEINANLDVFGR